MNKILLIIQREYITRVRKRSFIIMTLLAPLLMAALIIVPVWLTEIEDDDLKTIAVIDNPENNFKDFLSDTKSIHFEYIDSINAEEFIKNSNAFHYYALLYNSNSKDGSFKNVTLCSNIQPSITVKMHIEKAIEKKIEFEKLAKLGLTEEIIKSLKSNISIKTLKLKEDGSLEKTSTELTMAISFVAAIIIYMFIFIYGSQVMRSVIEEKTSRIIEIIISSVKPVQLMMGKIIGVALVALTQFVLWIILTFVVISIIQTSVLPHDVDYGGVTPNIQQVNPAMSGLNELGLANGADVFKTLQNIPWIKLVGNFLFYFLGGYLLYTALFAAIGSAVDNDTETQQFMLPITIPLILGFVMAQPVIQNPEGSLAFWLSIIPFTSPIIMMVRIPFGVPVWQMGISFVVLIGTFIFATWFAAKIYRTGILMYGKKINYRELWKWLRYR